MEIFFPKLFIEINNSNYIFTVGDQNKQNAFKLIFKHIEPLHGIENNRVIDFKLFFNTIKKNIYTIEQKLNFTFKETVIILDNFNRSFISISGFKKLNGSQILKENITYILNSLKSTIDTLENDKTILHIFNTKYSLDKKKIQNIPIGLSGDFYHHELSFCLINNEDYECLINAFNRCNLKVKKILLKSFVEGAYLSDTNTNTDTFFSVNINENNTQVFYFENDALKYEQNFNFGSDLIIEDISKVVLLKKETVKNIIKNIKFKKNILNNGIIEKELFDNEDYQEIKKSLIADIATARIQELAEILIFKNINLFNFIKKKEVIFFKMKDQSNFNSFEDSYNYFFSNKSNFTIKLMNNIKINEIINNSNKIVHFGWKKEAVPIIQAKKSLIARFFNTLFG